MGQGLSLQIEESSIGFQYQTPHFLKNLKMNFDYLEIALGSFHFILLRSLGPEYLKIHNQIMGCQNQKLNQILSPLFIPYTTFVEYLSMTPTWVCSIIQMATSG